MILGEKSVKEIVCLLGVAILVAFVVNSISPKGIALKGSWNTDDGVISARSKTDIVVHEIEIQDVFTAKKIYDGNKTLFVDARHVDSYNKGFIKGAVSLPIYDYYELIDSFIVKHPFNQKIITYCSGRECDESHKLASYLKAEGFTDVKVFIDGLPAWEQNQFPTDKR